MKIQFSPTERTSSLLPALTISFGMIIWLARRRFDTAVGELFDAMSAHSSYATLAIFSLIFLGLIFLIAHSIDLFSAFLFERLYVDKLHGFPHERIVPVDSTTDRYKNFLASKRVHGFTWYPHQPLKALTFSAYAMMFILLLLELQRIFSFNKVGAPIGKGFLDTEFVATVGKTILWWTRLSFSLCLIWISVLAVRTKTITHPTPPSSAKTNTRAGWRIITNPVYFF